MVAEIYRNEKGTRIVERILAGAGIAAAGVACIAVWYFDPSKESFFPVCPLYRFTGIACPGCGLTRGFHALFHGDIPAALGYNAMIPVFSVLLGFFFVSMLLFAVRGKGLGGGKVPAKALWAILVIAGIFSVVRNIPAYPFNLLYP